MKIIDYSEEHLTSELKDKVYQGFVEHALREVGHDGEMVDFTFVARHHNEIIGAAVYKTFWGAVHIKYLWVAKEHRGYGVGKTLLNHVLEKARSLSCSFACVETMSFQAVDFYRKFGFEENFTRHGYAHGTSFHYLQKSLAISVRNCNQKPDTSSH